MGCRSLARCIALAALLAPLASCAAEESQLEACDDLSTQADAMRAEVLEQVDRTCSTDKDCSVTFLGLECRNDCNAAEAVARSAEAVLRGDVRRIDLEMCGKFSDRGCRIARKCGPPDSSPAAFCRAGRCELEYVPFE
jgi:hypothetical protein